LTIRLIEKMSITIRTNTTASVAQRHLAEAGDVAAVNERRLASGERITRAGDDAAGLSISSKIRGSVRSINQGIRNTHDGVSMIQTAEGGMTEIGNLLVRIRELSVQGASDTVGAQERRMIDVEVGQLMQEVDRIADTTQYNGKRLLSSNGTELEIQVGKDNDPDADRYRIERVRLNVGSESLGLEEISTLTRDDARNNLYQVDLAIERLSRKRAELGALQNRLFAGIAAGGVHSENLTAGRSRLADTEFAEATAALTRSQIQTQSNLSVLAQSHTSANVALKLIGNV
jgi:flagellin